MKNLFNEKNIKNLIDALKHSALYDHKDIVKGFSRESKEKYIRMN